MNALILAAGRGTRLKELTKEAPKCLARLQGYTLLEWQISALRAIGSDSISIVLGYRGEKIKQFLVGQNINYFENPDWETSNMVFTLLQADALLEKDVTIISYSDIFYDLAIPKKLTQSTHDIAISCDSNAKQLWEARMGKDSLSDIETLKLSPNNRILEIGKKTLSWSDVEGQYMGLLKLTPKGWKTIKKTIQFENVKKMDCTQLLQLLIEQGTSIYATVTQEKWGEVDTKEDLELYQNEPEKWVPSFPSCKQLIPQSY